MGRGESARGEPRVVAGTGSSAARADVTVRGDDGVRRCLGCGYELGGLDGEAVRCPECGREIERAPVLDPLGPMVVGEARSARTGAGLAIVGLVLVVVAPVVGAVVDAVGWWRLTAGPGRGRLSAPWLRGVVRGLTVAAGVVQVAAWVAVVDVYVLRLVVTNSVADDVAVGTAITVAIGVWTVRHGAACWWVGRIGRRVDDPSIVGSAIVSGVGAVGIAASGFVLIVLGVLVSHLALFPPLCLLLPLWFAGLAAWGLVTVVMLTKVRTRTGEVTFAAANGAADGGVVRTLGGHAD